MQDFFCKTKTPVTSSTWTRQAWYRSASRRTIARAEKVAGAKIAKGRITVALTANADGSEFFPPLFVRFSKSPVCFKHQTAEELGFDYDHSSKAWMNARIFQDWLRRWNSRLVAEERHITLIVDGVSSHKIDNLELSNIIVHEFMPKVTAHIQPMDAGAIAALKACLSTSKAHKADPAKGIVTPDDLRSFYQIDVLTAMTWAKRAWERTKPESMVKYGKKIMHAPWRVTDLLNPVDNERHCVPEVPRMHNP
ncbi:TPA: hypothetical protein N0F65_002814 [Lagenidium giganteum]|uniref:DDE-1 domain-containing protein n=1 Tax=Lagenidium giganteum TaxID=4803 RepID=A0AAV2ZAR7_9STRA|nr:TPA: hypothetical protein N0F65_002814 [Lagenidium giganteum]